MNVNLNVLWDILKKFLDALGRNNNSQKQESSTSNQNNGSNNNIATNGGTINTTIINNIFIENFNLNGSTKNANLIETNELAVIKKVWPSIEKDLPIKFGSFDNLWLCVGESKDGKKYINIGKYYSCTVNGKEIVFWLGAEAMDETYVKLYINKDQLDKLELKRETLCEEGPKDGVFQPRITEFSTDVSQEVLEAALNKKLKTFLEDIFNDR
jgi:hypothetical protein